MPDVHLCNTSYYVGFESCSYSTITLENRNRSWSQTQKEVIDTTHGCFGGNGMTQPVPYPQSRNQYIFSDALSCSTTPDMMSKKLKKMLKCGIAKSWRNMTIPSPRKSQWNLKSRGISIFLRAGTMSGLEHFLGSEFRNHVLQCPSPPPQQVHQSSTAASKKARDPRRETISPTRKLLQ